MQKAKMPDTKDELEAIVDRLEKEVERLGKILKDSYLVIDQTKEAVIKTNLLLIQVRNGLWTKKRKK